MIAHITKAPYGEYLRMRIFDRAGLSKTRVDDESEILIGRINGYTTNKTAPSGFRQRAFHLDDFPGGAGSLRSTAEDHSAPGMPHFSAAKSCARPASIRC